MTSWLNLAESYIGHRENTSKTEHSQFVLEMLNKMGSFNGEGLPWWRDDEQPWCGLFVGYCLGQSGMYVIKEWYRAREWAGEPMTRLARPAVGAVAAMARQGGGHVAFVVGKDKSGNIMCIGGNQSNAVTLAAFDSKRIDGYFWPARREGKGFKKQEPHGTKYILPLIESSGGLSENEA